MIPGRAIRSERSYTILKMALSQITDEIWIGSIMALRAERTLKDSGVTGILSVLGTDDFHGDSDVWRKQPIFAQMKKHLVLEIQDLEETNIIQYFDETNDFLQEAHRLGEGTLVHCVAGISRSVTCVCAYLMKTNKWTPEMAISYVQTRRSIANPNEGFREQLQVYYECGYQISDEAKPYRQWKLKQGSRARGDSRMPIYTQVSAPPLIVPWKPIIPALMKRSGFDLEKSGEIYHVSLNDVVFAVTEPVADAINKCQPSKIKLISKDSEYEVQPSVLAEVMKQVVTRMISFRCKGCSVTLASSSSVIRHKPGPEGQCQHFFLEPVEWMRPELEKGALEGKLLCPKCTKKVGSYLWQGSRCSCGLWITPTFKLSKAKVDEMAMTSRPLL